MFYFYFIEIIFRFIHIIVSFILCSTILIYNINWLLLFIIYPFLELFTKKFIITHVMDFFDTIWIIVCSISFLFVLPFVSYQLLNFFKSSWYIYQANILKEIFYRVYVIISIIASVCYSILLPTALSFFYWEKLEQKSSILIIESDLRILDFVSWIFNFQFSFTFLISFYLITIVLLWILFRIEKIYFLIKLYRKIFSFASLIFLFVLLPSEVFLQFFLIFFVILLYEIVFFFVCYKISNLN